MGSPQGHASGRQIAWTATTILGGVVIALAPLLPWVTATSPELGEASRSGFDVGRGAPFAVAAGVVAVVAGTLLLGHGELRRLGVQLAILSALVAGFLAWLGWQDAADPASSLLVSRDEVVVTHAVGWGVWLLGLGAVFVLAGAVAAAITARDR